RIRFMANRALLREFDLTDEELERELQDFDTDWAHAGQVLEAHEVVRGRVVGIVGEDVIVDVRSKSEGIIPLSEWRDEATGEVNAPKVGDEIEVLLDSAEDDSGTLALSYRKARLQGLWNALFARYQEGAVVRGTVGRKTKGGLLVQL